MPELPSGTVTFLFTDIEGSTRLLEELGGRYAEVLSEHRRVVRQALERHEGVEVDTQGDAFFIAFSSAAAAAAAAAEAQAALSIPVRMGIHTGEPQLVESGYVGIDVHRAARICAVAHGGQVLVSQTTKDLVDAELVDLGGHRLKDVGELRLYQLGTQAFPPLRSLKQTNLPTPSEPLLGRKKELADVLRLIRAEGVRLVTITGPGGIGKTRFALELASELVADFADGVWFVDLSPLRQPGLVGTAIGTALGAMVELADHVATAHVLLVLDNFEQVVDASPLVGGLVERCPNLCILVTSREALQLRSEHRYPLHPLAESPAIELFRQRAQAVDPDFDSPYGQLASICAALDNLPLALELAAARTKLFAPSDLLARLQERLPVLGSRGRGVPERQRTLRAAIEWSYDLLSAEEKELFSRLAVFAGGFTVEAAEHICEADLDVLESLVDKSLVRQDGGRFGMLETVREFAQGLFDRSPDAMRIGRRHADYYGRLADRSEPDLTGVRQSETVAALAADYDNIRKALALLEDAEPDEFLRAAAALSVFWYVRSLYGEGREWLERALTEGSAAHEARARALWGLACMRLLSGDPAHAAEPLHESVTLAAQQRDEATEARCHSLLGLLALFTNDLAASRSLFEQGAALARRANDAWCLADSLGTLASIYPLQGDLDPAEAAGREGLEIARRNLDEHGIRMSLFGLALTASRRGDHALAAERAREGLQVSRSLGDRWFTSYFLWLLADAALAVGDLEAAAERADEAVDVAERVAAPLLLSCALDVRARVASLRGDDAAALRDSDAAVAVSEQPGVLGSYVAAALATRAQLAAGRGELAVAERLVGRAVEIAEEVGDGWARQRALQVRAGSGCRRAEP